MTRLSRLCEAACGARNLLVLHLACCMKIAPHPHKTIALALDGGFPPF
jgi:hypothetical protein